MATAESVKAKINNLIAKANSATGKSDTNLTSGINSLIDGFGIETEEWDGTGVVIAPIEPEQPMTFTINGTSYQMDNRMTWYAWTRSEYNTDGFACANENDYVYEAESTNKVTDAKGNDVLGTTYIVEGGVYLIKEAVTEDELAGTWVFTDYPTSGPGGTVTWDVAFTCDGFDYNFLKAQERPVGMWIWYDSTKVLAGGSTINLPSWSSTSYKTITITSKLSKVTNGSTLLEWLKANATKQSTNVNTYDITVNNNTVYEANSDNPTQIKAGETVTLSFSTDGPRPTVAVSATNATRSFSYGTRSITVTLSNATGDVVLTIDETDPEPV